MISPDQILKIADYYDNSCSNLLIKVSKIRKLPNGKYRVLSMKGRNLGTYRSQKAAKKRLQQIEYFKHVDKSNADAPEKEKIDLSKVDEFSYSSLCRELNKLKDKKPLKFFLKRYKINFDKLIKDKSKHPEKIALEASFIEFAKVFDVKINKKMVKVAASASLGDPVAVGKYLADIVKFMMNRISPSKRQLSLNKLKSKFYYLDEKEIAVKKMPSSSAMGQSITFVKTVLLQHDAKYIRDVLNNLVKFL